MRGHAALGWTLAFGALGLCFLGAAVIGERGDEAPSDPTEADVASATPTATPTATLTASRGAVLEDADAPPAPVDGPTAREFLADWPGGDEIVASLTEMGYGEKLDTSPAPPPPHEARAAIRELLLPDRSTETPHDAPGMSWPAELDDTWVRTHLRMPDELDEVQLMELRLAGEQETQLIFEEYYRPYRLAHDEAFVRELDAGGGRLQPYALLPTGKKYNYFSNTGMAWNGWMYSIGLDRDAYPELVRQYEDVRRRVRQRDERLRQLVRSWR